MYSNANTIAGYLGSRDYDLLADLARRSSVVCFVDYRTGEGEPLRDVARTHCDLHHGKEVFLIAARGFGYIHAFGEDEFRKFCVHWNVEFIEPSSTAAVGQPTEAAGWIGAVKRAYGHLWHAGRTQVTDSTSPSARAIREAKVALLSVLTPAQQADAVAEIHTTSGWPASRHQYPPDL
ncbi:hypothetical protein E2P84_38980 [Burkholderia cepacia]|uniref:Uncharacterized protein n=1 Tax=Burkholderia cepacia TaxID=292 RepID=A0AAX2RF86_BURCE|nr:hypothetical protein [Burkholderia cepacia]TES63849.1 hypothetical protein E2P84_38980 [Burkholderia cepacia]TES96731.1 hypothetical protein E3D36_34780 [Burkholderia cepacia]TEU34419.1 hypothetical protein E3D37_39060 [Burkholderia cepacia]TEU38529.1 hypothetical protein E3D38_37630 [Burkholderia cepacia]TEU87166.1 hypothetical protein E3D40_39410 [Burkholderia cepacia]